MNLKSMTGYGTANGHVGEFVVSVEVTSLNSRFLDPFISLPDFLDRLELPIRARIKDQVKRGRVRVRVKADQKGISDRLVINETLVRDFLGQFERIAREYPISIDPVNFLNVPGLVDVEKGEPDFDERRFWPIFERAMKGMLKTRRAEGRSITRDLREGLRQIKSHLRKIERLKKKELAQERKRIKAALKNTPEGISYNNKAEEMIASSSRLDTQEEISRIHSHVSQFEDAMKAGNEMVGRKMEFLLQELHREITTLSRKSLDKEIVALTVEFREEIERLREQVRNVE
jgi:uncharacterized protein (TIGR00255 family)